MIRFIVSLFIFSIFITGCQEKQADSFNKPDWQLIEGELSYSIPQDWKSEKPKSKLRKAQYLIPGVDGNADAEMAVFVFPGTGGSVQANIDRWVGQFRQPDGSNSKEKTETQEMTVNNLNVTTVYLTGIYLQSASPMMMGGPKMEKREYAISAAIVETNKDPWFFKMVGPQKTVDHWRQDFNEFVKSFK